MCVFTIFSNLVFQISNTPSYITNGGIFHVLIAIQWSSTVVAIILAQIYRKYDKRAIFVLLELLIMRNILPVYDIEGKKQTM